MIDSLGCALRELRRRKGRTVATIAGYLLALAIMVVLVTLINYGKELTTGVSKGIGKHFIAYSPWGAERCCELSEPTPSEWFIAQEVLTDLLDRKLVDRIKAIPTVLDASPFLYFRFQNKETGAIFTVGGFEPGDSIATRTTTCEASDIVSGRFLTPEDRGLVMLEEAFASSKNLKPRDKIDIAGKTFYVSGIVRQTIKPVRPNILMHMDDAREVINRRLPSPIRDQFNVVLVEAKTSEVNAKAQEAVKNVIPNGVSTGFMCYEPAAKITKITRVAVWLISIVIGISVFFLSMRFQSQSVIERQKEIGILKAIGWTNGNVLSLIITESTLQAIIGGILGFLVAVVILAIVPFGGLIKELVYAETVVPKTWVPLTLSPQQILTILGLVVIGGIAGGIFPALRAARLRPADALRRI